ncbi:hypothetical protein EON65_09730 [archaeon]|nr:MAG: hypothetical protein EON65_09730 [archaeon]
MGGGASRSAHSNDATLTNDSKLPTQVNNPMTKNSENKDNCDNDDTLKVAWVASETAWMLGEQFISSIK